MALSIYMSSRVVAEEDEEDGHEQEENPILEKIWIENRRYQIAGLIFLL